LFEELGYAVPALPPRLGTGLIAPVPVVPHPNPATPPGASLSKLDDVVAALQAFLQRRRAAGRPSSSERPVDRADCRRPPELSPSVPPAPTGVAAAATAITRQMFREVGR
jgi:hypothetical protein